MSTTWKEKLQGRVPEDWGREIDAFEAQMMLRKAGKIEEKVFAETRLRRGTYGQRYDNGRRHDGVKTQDLHYPPHAKGPDTLWHALGMQRIQIAFSGCEHEACALVSIHDFGGIAKVMPGPDGKPVRGFALYVGGGLGAVPHQAKLYEEFVPAEEVLPLARAIGRVFARMGEKK